MKKIFTLILLAYLTPFIITAQWNGNPAASGIPVCNAPSSDFGGISITDGSNGSIVIFSSTTTSSITGSSYERIQAQRISANGVTVWGNSLNPKSISDTGSLYVSHAIPDGTGGAFIAYEDYRTDFGELIIQHINSSGNITWAASGINVSNNALTDDYAARLVADGSGGVIVTWTSEVYDETNDIYTYLQSFAQRINSSGVIQWAAGGVQLSTASGFRGFAEIVSDGAGGAILFFTDTRNSAYLPGSNFEFPNTDIYAQRLSPTGQRLWGNNGVDVCTEPNVQAFNSYYKMEVAAADGAGGAILVFGDTRGGNAQEPDLCTQRINNNGVKQWTAAGVFVCVAANYQEVQKVVSNGAQGIIAFWLDERVSNSRRYYAQQVTAAGSTAWTTNGVLLSGNSDNAGYYGDLRPDGLGNYIATWTAYTTGGSSEMVKAQKINNSGVAQWTTGGVNVYSNPNASSTYDPQVVISDNGKAIIVWNEYNFSGSASADFFAKKLEANGVLPLTLTEFFATVDKGDVLLKWTTSNEQNTYNFEVQRSQDNQNFTTIATVNAAGFSITDTKYNFTDFSPFTGVSYYRLKQNDKDGAYTYSPIRTISINAGNAITVKVLGNPVINNARISVYSPKAQQAEYSLLNAGGQQLWKRNQSLTEGMQQFDVQTENLAKGNYTIVIHTKEERITLPIQKL